MAVGTSVGAVRDARRSCWRPRRSPTRPSRRGGAPPALLPAARHPAARPAAPAARRRPAPDVRGARTRPAARLRRRARHGPGPRSSATTWRPAATSPPPPTPPTSRGPRSTSGCAGSSASSGSTSTRSSPASPCTWPCSPWRPYVPDAGPGPPPSAPGPPLRWSRPHPAAPGRTPKAHRPSPPGPPSSTTRPQTRPHARRTTGGPPHARHRTASPREPRSRRHRPGRLHRRAAQGRAARPPRGLRLAADRRRTGRAPHGSTVPTDPDALGDYFAFRDFAHFIEVYLSVVDLIRDAEDVRLLTYEVARDMARQQIRYAELTVTPYTLDLAGIAERGVHARPSRTPAWRPRPTSGVDAALVLRHPRRVRAAVRGGDRSASRWTAARRAWSSFGLGGPEIGVPRPQFKPYFDPARAAGCTACRTRARPPAADRVGRHPRPGRRADRPRHRAAQDPRAAGPPGRARGSRWRSARPPTSPPEPSPPWTSTRCRQIVDAGVLVTDQQRRPADVRHRPEPRVRGRRAAAGAGPRRGRRAGQERGATRPSWTPRARRGWPPRSTRTPPPGG